ncbi:MAG: glycerophosphodiester phosphodiesterase, partial [Chloroflexota bacterium]|nr:glycerophosphodiester phosphodiesterase [Chloroflexota bacterium]
SFSVATVRHLAELAPAVPRFQLVPPGFSVTSESLDGLRTYAHGIGPYKDSVTADLLECAHDRELLVIPYTVNAPGEMARLLDLGVDGLISDNPVALRIGLRASTLDHPTA